MSPLLAPLPLAPPVSGLLDAGELAGGEVTTGGFPETRRT